MCLSSGVNDYRDYVIQALLLRLTLRNRVWHSFSFASTFSLAITQINLLGINASMQELTVWGSDPVGCRSHRVQNSACRLLWSSEHSVECRWICYPSLWTGFPPSLCHVLPSDMFGASASATCIPLRKWKSNCMKWREWRQKEGIVFKRITEIKKKTHFCFKVFGYTPSRDHSLGLFSAQQH